jgi:hypothetical protein
MGCAHLTIIIGSPILIFYGSFHHCQPIDFTMNKFAMARSGKLNGAPPTFFLTQKAIFYTVFIYSILRKGVPVWLHRHSFGLSVITGGFAGTVFAQ